VSEYVVRPMQLSEARLALEWAAAEGWNPGLHDAESFFETDPSGCFIGLLDGEPIASLAGLAYDGTYGFLGLYIVRPEHRGDGYGLRIWEEAVAYLGERNVGLDGVLAQQANYERSGFTLAYRNVRYEGHRPEVASASRADIVPLAGIPFEDVLRYDTACFPVERRDFLGRWVAQPDSVVLALRRGAALGGFGVIRKCRSGYKVGPLLADDAEAAEALLIGLSARIEAEAPLYLDVPEPNRAAVQLAEGYGMTPVFETVRMYSKGEPKVRLDRIFGVTTFELG
jgi:GNAT superfamily N-acetyltransferase